MQSYLTNQKFIDILDDRLSKSGKTDAYVCARVGKNRSWISHLRKGKINSISIEQCDAIAKVLSMEYNLPEAERKKVEEKMSMEFYKALAENKNNSLSEHSLQARYNAKYGMEYKENFELSRVLKNREFLKEILDILKAQGYSPSLFVEEIVQTKKEVTITNYDDTPLSVKTSNYPKEYLDNFLNDETWETTFKDLSVIVYCYLEVLFSKSPEQFLKKYGKISKRNLEKKKNLREKTKELLLQTGEYPDLKEFEYDDDDDDDDDEINIVDIAMALPDETPERFAILQVLTALNDLNQYHADLNKDKSDNDTVSFLETIQRNLCCESYDYVLGIYGLDILKIRGALNRKKFVNELQQLYKKYTEE